MRNLLANLSYVGKDSRHIQLPQNMEIFIQNNGSKEGLFTKDQIQAGLQSGNIVNTTLAWHEGLSNWLPVMAVIAPRATPPEFKKDEEIQSQPAETSIKTQTEAFESARAKPNETFSKIFTQTKSIGWKNILPVDAARSEKPWNLVWVRWVGSFLIAMSAVQHFSSTGDLNPKQVAFLLVVIWTSAWAFGLSFVIRPEKARFKRAMCLILPTLGHGGRDAHFCQQNLFSQFTLLCHFL